MLCAVCFGDPASSLTTGLNYGILSLLAVIFTILACFAALFINIRNRSKFIA